jgi:N-acylglucosamine 2-epimerase
MNQDRLKSLYATYHGGLLNDTLPFWLPNCVDRGHGGFTFALDRQGDVYDTDKGMWQQCRFTWMISEIYNEVEQRPEWLELARHGVEFIDRHGFDTDGRMWFHVTKEGKPIRKRRYVFTETFACIAYAAYATASGDQSYAEKAEKLFDQVVAWTSTPGALPAKFTNEREAKGIGFPMIMTNVVQQLRKHLGGDRWNAYLDDYIGSMRDDFMKHDIECVMETLALDNSILDTFDGRLLNPGHAIEGAWFVMQESRIRGIKRCCSKA